MLAIPSSSYVPVIGFWDRCGLSLSGLCAVHCMLTPLSLTLLPLAGAYAMLEAWLHPVLAVLIVPVTLAAIWAGYRRHRSTWAPLLLGSGLVLVLVATLVPDLLGTPGETITALVGSSLLIAGHWGNQHRGAC